MELSILGVTKRTLKKIIIRLNIGCSSCGWNDCVGDIHHIIPQSKGGTHDHSNLTYLCPNCHRKVHNNQVVEYKTLQEQVGDRWLDFYFPEKAGIDNSFIKRKIFEKNQNRLFRSVSIEKYKELILNSDIDFSKIGWVKQVSEIIGICPQKTGQWMFHNMPDFYETCYKRKKNEHIGTDALLEGP